jgi:hypothetical protein
MTAVPAIKLLIVGKCNFAAITTSTELCASSFKANGAGSSTVGRISAIPNSEEYYRKKDCATHKIAFRNKPAFPHYVISSRLDGKESRLLK